MIRIADALELLAEGSTLTSDQTRSVVLEIMGGECPDAQIAAYLTALRVRGETVDELVGTASAMREKLPPLALTTTELLDTCGTGGDQSGTFNISTASAIVVAGCGVPVAKHGNRSVSSSSGSADVLTCLGVDLEAEAETVADCLESIGLAFFFAPRWHPAMKHVMAARRLLRFRTIFNLVGPLSNPAGAAFQLVGVGRPEWADKLAEALGRLGTRSAAVVCGEDGLDEVTLAAPTRAVCVEGGKRRIETWTADSFGLPGASGDDWRVDSPGESAAVIQRVLAGESGPCRNIVLANAAVALRVVGRTNDLKDGVELAAQAIDSGEARAKLDKLVEHTNRTR